MSRSSINEYIHIYIYIYYIYIYIIYTYIYIIYICIYWATHRPERFAGKEFNAHADADKQAHILPSPLYSVLR
jgi:hypothetical protein